MIRYFAIPSGLEGLCGVGYSFRTGADGADVRLSALMPQLQVVVAGGMRHRFGAADAADAHAVTLVGPTHAASDISIAPHSLFYGVTIIPAAWPAVTRMGADALADRLVDAGSVWGSAAEAALFRGVGDATTDATAVDRLFSFVAEQAYSAERFWDHRHAIVDGWIARAGRATLDDLRTALELSGRQAERLSLRLYGCGPKRLMMKYRTLRLATALALTHHAGDEAEPFYDQAHMINNFKRFTGFTPARFQADQGGFAREMLELRWQAGARSALSLWS